MLSNPALAGITWLGTDRILYVATDADGISDNLWEITLDPTSGGAQFEPRRLTNWAGFHFDDLSISADGKRLVFHRWVAQSAVYVADFDQHLKSIHHLRRLTFADADEVASAWTQDSNAVIFTSDRLGHRSIYKQEVNSTAATLLLDGKEGADIVDPRLSPDASWIVYHDVTPRSNDPGEWLFLPSRMMRVRVEGGAPEVLFHTTYYGLRCTQGTKGFCVNPELSADGQELVFFSFDPVHASRQELVRFKLRDSEKNASYVWDISPDGNAIALAKFDTSMVYMLSRKTRLSSEVVPTHVDGIRAINFAPDTHGLFIYSVKGANGSFVYADPSGKGHVLLRHSAPQCWAIPSPDGKRVAIDLQDINANMWSVEDF